MHSHKLRSSQSVSRSIYQPMCWKLIGWWRPQGTRTQAIHGTWREETKMVGEPRLPPQAPIQGRGPMAWHDFSIWLQLRNRGSLYCIFQQADI